MYIDNQIKEFRVSWSDHIHHAYRRVSRSKWDITLSYACGAEMVLENQPDDLIQCLLLGAFNSRKDIRSDAKDLLAGDEGGGDPLESFRDLQGRLLDA